MISSLFNKMALQLGARVLKNFAGFTPAPRIKKKERSKSIRPNRLPSHFIGPDWKFANSVAAKTKK